MPVMFWGGVVLFRFGAVALDPACCCFNLACCCKIDPRHTYHLTISAPYCSNDLDGKVIDMFPGISLRGCYGFTGNATASACTNAILPIVVNIRCNLDLPDRGGGICDKYEIQFGYGASACANDTSWRRVEPGCSCDPISLVFKVQAPQWNGLGTSECDCCVPPDDLTVTLTW